MGKFASIAPFYDRMVNFSRRLSSDSETIKSIIARFNPHRVLDAGCGSGVHAIILARLGVDVTGLDASPEMLDLARSHARDEDVKLPLVQATFESMPAEWTGTYDLILCLANSLAGVETGKGLVLALRSFYRVLGMDGKALVQVLNIDRFRREERRIIKVTRNDDLTFVRFFDFDTPQVRLNVIVIDESNNDPEHHLVSSPVFPIDAANLKLAAKSSGFTRISLHNDLSLSSAFDSSTDNLVAVLAK
jgi:ubiquinone/menaquinone biosynthesis C-methylase UbiE